MHRLLTKNSSINVTRNSYLEFNFFNGVMVDCCDPDKPWDSPSGEILGVMVRTGREDASGSIRPLQRVSGDDVPKKFTTSTRNNRCMSALGIHMCNCEDDSLDCNLMTCMMSPLDGANSKHQDISQGKMVPNTHPEQKLGSRLAEALSPGDDGYLMKGRAPGNNLDSKSAMAAWAAVMSDSSFPMAVTSSVETPRTGKGPWYDKDRLPTLASHLEHTRTAVAQCKLHHDLVEGIDVPGNGNSTLQREVVGLKLNPHNLSICDPAPYGTMHGLLHCTLSEGLPNYTLLLDDYEEVVTAKLWMEDMVIGNVQGAWRYSFYSLRGETKRKGKTGWKHWRKKEKLNSMIVGKMEVSSVLCSDEKHNLWVKSECILTNGRVNGEEPAAKNSNQTLLCLSETEPLGCSNGTPSSTSSLLMTSSDGFSNISSPVTTPKSWSELPISSPSRFVEAESDQGNKPRTQKWSLRSSIQSILVMKARKKDASPMRGAAASNLNAHDISAWSDKQMQPEIAALIINVPLEVKNLERTDHKKHRTASITVILPSGNHGRPVCDAKGPSPLLDRWKDGGKCDCRGWDLGCGLMVLSNSSQKAPKFVRDEAHKVREAEAEGQCTPLMLYKQDTDQEDAFLSLVPQANGLVALDFRAPLSPLQAFAIAVAILHGRESNVPTTDAPKRTLAGCAIIETQPNYAHPNQTNDERDVDGLCMGLSNSKEVQAHEFMNFLSHPNQHLSRSFVNVQGRGVLNRASELALPLERV